MKIFEQKTIPLLGAINQVLGGAISWVTIMIFVFSAITAWNTQTMGYVRDIFPWLNMGYFMAIVVIGIIFAMFLQHKYTQSSVIDYWGKMFWKQTDSKEFLDRQKRLETAVYKLLIVLADKQEYSEVKKILNEVKDT